MMSRFVADTRSSIWKCKKWLVLVVDQRRIWFTFKLEVSIRVICSAVLSAVVRIHHIHGVGAELWWLLTADSSRLSCWLLVYSVKFLGQKECSAADADAAVRSYYGSWNGSLRSTLYPQPRTQGVSLLVQYLGGHS